jgi:hypothetical protein
MPHHSAIQQVRSLLKRMRFLRTKIRRRRCPSSLLTTNRKIAKALWGNYPLKVTPANVDACLRGLPSQRAFCAKTEPLVFLKYALSGQLYLWENERAADQVKMTTAQNYGLSPLTQSKSLKSDDRQLYVLPGSGVLAEHLHYFCKRLFPRLQLVQRRLSVIKCGQSFNSQLHLKA